MPPAPQIKRPKSIHKSRPLDKLYIAKFANIVLIDVNTISYNIFDYPVCDSVSSISEDESEDMDSRCSKSNEEQDLTTHWVRIYHNIFFHIRNLSKVTCKYKVICLNMVLTS